jgi:hypothetical protein
MSQIIKKEIEIIKKQIISVVILSFAFVMIFSTVNVGLAANTGDTNLAQNILAGTLDMAAPSQLDFTNVSLNGSQQYSNTNFNGVNVTDYRGGAGTGWNLTVYANNLVAGTNNISITARLNVAPGQVTSDKNAAAGSNFMMPNSSGSAAVLMNASSSNGTGVSNITNSLFKLNIEAGDTAGTYTATMTFTVSS